MRQIIWLLVALLGWDSAYAQTKQSLYFDSVYQIVDDAAVAAYTGEITFAGGKGPGGVRNIFYLSGAKRAEQHFSQLKPKVVLEGPSKGWYENGKPEYITHYLKGQAAGEEKQWYESGQLKCDILREWGPYGLTAITTYYPDGTLRRQEKSMGHELLEGRCFTATGQDTVYFPFKVMPTFTGGEVQMNRFLASTIRYPPNAFRRREQGLVVVRFLVNEVGEISEVRLMESVTAQLDFEALRVVSLMPPWNPGMEEGKVVPVKFTLPIRFNIR